MTAVPVFKALEMAIRFHSAGQLQQAEQIYRQILQAEPGHAESWHLLGMIAYQAGQRETAIEYVQRSLALLREKLTRRGLGEA